MLVHCPEIWADPIYLGGNSPCELNLRHHLHGNSWPQKHVKGFYLFDRAFLEGALEAGFSSTHRETSHFGVAFGVQG